MGRQFTNVPPHDARSLLMTRVRQSQGRRGWWAGHFCPAGQARAEMPVPQTNGGRPGFTLIELLIVVAIIGVLVALTAGAVMQVMASQQVRATEATLQKGDSALNHQWKASIDMSNDEWRKGTPPAAGLQSSLMTWAGNNTDLAKAGYVQLRLMQEFPVNLTEATMGVALPTQNGVTPSLVAKPSFKALGALSSGGGPTDSAVCLYYALTQAHRGMVNSLEDSVGQNGIKNLPNMKDAKVYVDVWGNPIWLTRSNSVAIVSVVEPAGGSTAGVTTASPHGFITGELVTISGVGTPGYNGTFLITGTPSSTTFTYTAGTTGLAAGAGGSATAFNLPVLWSAGPNGIPLDADDLSSAKLRAPGARGDS